MMTLFFLRLLATAGLFGLEVLVQEVQSLLVRLSTSHDREHALARLVVRGFRNRDSSSRAPADLRDLGSTTANDAAHHVSRNADVLGLDLFAIFGDKGITTVGNVGVGSTAVTRLVAKIGSVAGAVVRASAAVTVGGSRGSLGHGSGSGTDRRTNRRVVEDGTGATLPVVDEALSNLPDRLIDALGGSLHFNNAFSRLGEHFLLGNHAHARCILDVLDLQALTSDNSTHLVVRDQKTNG